MSGSLYDTGATANCPHGGQVSVVSSNSRVLAGNVSVATIADTYTVAGCAFMVGGKPQPCVSVQWLVAAARVLINGQPPLLQTSTGLCLSADQIPGGPPTIVSTQIRAVGS